MTHPNNKTNPAAATAGQGLGARFLASRVYFSTTGKPVATLAGRILRKRVRGSLHQLRRPPAWAIDSQILQAARQDGAVMVVVTDVESHKVYVAPLSAFDRWGVTVNRGFGDQVALPLQYWRVESQDARQLSLLEA